MLLNLINITKEDIEISSEKSVSDDNSIVMYLQNNIWINEDLEA